MSKMYKVKVNAAEGRGDMVELPPVRPDGAPVRLKAQPGVRYQLFDPETGFAPENIRVDRKGKDLLELRVRHLTGVGAFCKPWTAKLPDPGQAVPRRSPVD